MALNRNSTLAVSVMHSFRAIPVAAVEVLQALDVAADSGVVIDENATDLDRAMPWRTTPQGSDFWYTYQRAAYSLELGHIEGAKVILSRLSGKKEEKKYAAVYK
jgi:hypothetical protein